MGFGAQIIELQEKIAASLYLEPATIEELCKREFLEYISDFNVEMLLQMLEKKNWVYFGKDEKYYTYKRIAEKELKKYGYSEFRVARAILR